jgi:dUTP pyrophosphatase
MSTPVLKVYRTHPSIILPNWATEGSACFDIAYQMGNHKTAKYYTRHNEEMEQLLSEDWPLTVPRGGRAKIPTGLIFDIPKGYSLRCHPRSGLAWKQGLTLANCEGVIDHDYVEESFILLLNTTRADQFIRHGERLMQAELVPVLSYLMVETTEPPLQKTSRAGGFGSTGQLLVELKVA